MLHDRMVRARKFVHFDFGLLLENHGESNTKMTSVVIARAKGAACGRGKISKFQY